MGMWPFDQRCPRLRRFGKWLGLVVVVLIVGVDVVSVRWTTGGMIWRGTGRGNVLVRILWLEGGQMGLQRLELGFPDANPNSSLRTSFFGVTKHEFRHSMRWDREPPPYGSRGGMVVIPLWAPAMVVAIPSAWLWWRDRPSRRQLLTGHCSTCDYNLAGLGRGQPCPECGKASAIQ